MSQQSAPSASWIERKKIRVNVARHKQIHLEINRLEREHGHLHAELDIISVEHNSRTGEPFTEA